MAKRKKQHVSEFRNVEIQESVCYPFIADNHDLLIPQNRAQTLSREEYLQKLDDYRRRVLKDTEFINFQGIPLPRDPSGRFVPLRVPLESVYIQIQVQEEKQSRARREAERKRLENQLKDGENYESRGSKVLNVLRTLREYSSQRRQENDDIKRPAPVSPEVALQTHHRMVILGEPGAGKSTLLQYFIRKAAKNPNGPVPIFISLKEYATALVHNSALSLREFTISQNCGNDLYLRTALEKAADEGLVLWLVDALDETRGWREVAARQVSQLSGDLVLTSRPFGYQSTGLEALPHFDISELTPENINGFLNNWFNVLAELQGTDRDWIESRVTWLKNQLEQRPNLRALTEKPLLLIFFVILAGNDPLQDLPHHRAELYRRFIENLLACWEAQRRPRGGVEGTPTFSIGQLSGEQAHRAMLHGIYYIGWYLHFAYRSLNENALPTRRALCSVLPKYLEHQWGFTHEAACAVINTVIEFWLEAGLLEVWHLYGEEYLTFRHLTFQEYGTAWVLAEAWKKNPQYTWKFIFPWLHHYAWREPLLLLSSLLEKQDKNEFVRRLLDGSSRYERSLHRDLRLAADLVKESDSLDAKLIKKLHSRLSRLMRRDSAVIIVFFSTFLIGIFLTIQAFSISTGMGIGTLIITSATIFFGIFPQLHAVFAMPARILGIVQDPIPYLHSLGKLGDIAIQTLIKALRNPNRSVSEAAVRTLGEIGGLQAVGPLIKALYDREWGVRWAAQFALGKIGEPAIEPLAEELRRIQDAPKIIYRLRHITAPEPEEVREAFVRALGQIKSIRVIEFLKQALNDEEWKVRWAAVQALEEMEFPQAVEVAIEALKDKDWMVRAAAATVLGQKRDTQAIEPLIRTFNDGKREVCRNAVEALGKIGEPAIKSLSEALTDDRENVREAVVEALGYIGGSEVIHFLAKALDDESLYVRHRAAEAFGKIRLPESIPCLIHAFEDKHWYVRKAAAKSMIILNDPQTIPCLTKALRNTDYQVRSLAAEVLGELKASQAIDDLIKALSDSDYYVRIKIAEALGKIGDDRAIPVLIRVLESYKVLTEWRIGQTAARALGQIGDFRAVEVLIEALDRLDEEVREASALSLGQIGDPCAIDPLIQSLSDKNEKVRIAAAQALGNLRARKAVAPLAKCLCDGDEKVRIASVKALGQSGNSEAIKLLEQALTDKLVIVRQAAVEALDEIGGSMVVRPLISALSDDNVFGDNVASEALVKVRDPQTIRHLIPALNSHNWKRRANAAKIIGQLSDTIHDSKFARRIVRALWWRLTDITSLGSVGDYDYHAEKTVGKAAFHSLEQVLNRLSELETSEHQKIELLVPPPRSLSQKTRWLKYGVNISVLMLVWLADVFTEIFTNFLAEYVNQSIPKGIASLVLIGLTAVILFIIGGLMDKAHSD